MTIHGYNAEDLLIGTMISLPKDHKANIVTKPTTGAFAYVLVLTNY